jgi:hypothetical protein
MPARATPPSTPPDIEAVDGQASGPPAGSGEARGRTRKPRYGDSDCLFCAGSGVIEGHSCPECCGSGRSLPHRASE